MSFTELASLIDHTLLRPEATITEIDDLCTEAKEWAFFSVCVHPYWVLRCSGLLKKTPVKVCAVVGFPFGCNTSATKAYEASAVIEAGADEIDMVINLAALKSEKWNVVENDIETVVRAAEGRIVKVIIETSLLNQDEKIRASQVVASAGAQFVKTSTGFNQGGATLEDVELMADTVGGKIGIKASGGIRDLEAMNKMIAAGATRIGTSHGVKILAGHLTQPGTY